MTELFFFPSRQLVFPPSPPPRYLYLAFVDRLLHIGSRFSKHENPPRPQRAVPTLGAPFQDRIHSILLRGGTPAPRVLSGASRGPELAASSHVPLVIGGLVTGPVLACLLQNSHESGKCKEFAPTPFFFVPFLGFFFSAFNKPHT